MFKNYLKIAWRSIQKEKFFTSIKIGGFALGITTCLLIALFIRDELGYDTHYSKSDQMYRVVLQAEINGEMKKSTHFPLPMAQTLEADFPEIEKAGKIYGSALSSGGKRAFRSHAETQNVFEQGFLYGDQNIFEILEIPLLQGNPEEALIGPRNLVISESKAVKYFPNGKVLGQTLILDDNASRPYTVTGVMPDFPSNSHLHFDFLLPIDDSNASWTSQNYFTYVVLDEKSDVIALQDKMRSILNKYVIPAQIKRGRDASFIEILKKITYKLQPIGDIHLKSDIEMADGLPHGNLRFVYLFAAIAGFILLLACINFINLSTARSANRAKEVGLRKTVGAFKSNLVAQFLTESVLFSLISFVLGVLGAWALLPLFNSITEKTIEMPWTAGPFIPVLLISALIIGIISGLYPAFYLSAFRPVNVLKGSLSIRGKSGRLRSGLVVFQFATSVVLIIGTLIIYKQMNFILEKDLGYDKEQVVILEGANILGSKADSFKEQLLQLNQVQKVSASDYFPVEGSKRNQTTFTVVGEGRENVGVLSQTWRIDYDYIKTMGMQIVDGRDFSREFASDSVNSIIINKKMAHDLGLELPLGKQIDNNYQHWNIIGVVDDFHFKSMKEDITPLAFCIGSDLGTIAVKVNPGNIAESLASITAIWNRNVPNQVLSYTFLDQRFAQMHNDVLQMGQIFNSFAFFAIFVACLGLFALAAFMAEQRKKEIGIRKVLGASILGITQLLSGDFIKLVLIAMIIAFPIAFWMMDNWLQDFAYRIYIDWTVFGIAGLVALAIALFTVSFQSVRAALTDPAKSLRTE
ncbi:ABC transporter permease [Ulvibacterium sp.]|uniref:ABC transporter permease n=1 Tax=Ulvibacterium sp. TaxID=2665914 RepID=UPI003CC63D34